MHRSTLALSGAALAGALVFTTAAPAMAFDCYNASRSGQGGTQAAAHSGKWASIAEFLAFDGVPQPLIDQVMVVINADPRIPAGFAVFIPNPASGREELAQPAPEKVVTDLRGIDHSADDHVLGYVIEDIGKVLGG
jgi:hypothetical protein